MRGEEEGGSGSWPEAFCILLTGFDVLWLVILGWFLCRQFLSSIPSDALMLLLFSFLWGGVYFSVTVAGVLCGALALLLPSTRRNRVKLCLAILLLPLAALLLGGLGAPA